MGREDILIILKMDLQISSTKYDDMLTEYIKLAEGEIKREGISIDTSKTYGIQAEDAGLIRMYAAYLYRSRKDGDLTMPRNLRRMLNNRLMSQKGRV